MRFDEFVNDERPGARRFRDILERERRDMAWLVHAVAAMYDEISGGRISKPMTYPDEVVGAFNERIDREVAEAVAAERGRIRAAVEGLDWTNTGEVRWGDDITLAAVLAIIDRENKG